MKYPNIILYRDSKYSHIDEFFEKNKDKLLCSVNIIKDEKDEKEMKKIFNCNYHLFITYGEKSSEYSDNMNKLLNTKILANKSLHIETIENIHTFNTEVNNAYMNLIKKNHENKRPIFSLFTTCYKSYEKIIRAYNSIKNQTMTDWEWVILDDSPDDEHFVFLKKTFAQDNQIRLYKRSENCGSIGNVKNEVVSLCRGKYVLEMDHDDEILPEVLLDATVAFENDKEIGFIYMDYANVYEDFRNFNYGNFFSLGYAGYYRQKYNNKWLYVAITPNINNITLSHIVSVPNHPRIWKREVLLKMGNFSEFLPVCDDYELLLRTAASTKIAKIQKLGYIQFMNNNNNNFSLIRNSEINRLVKPIKNMSYSMYQIDDKMKQKNAYEENNDNRKQIWKRNNFEYKYCNEIINLNYKKQICIIGLETINKLYSKIQKLYLDESTDFIVLDNKYSSNDDKLCNLLDFLNFSKMKCYSMEDSSDAELINYFHLVYRSCNSYYIINRNDTEIP
jgi:glycosyltransferase involved in cell wall biosynthesis